MAIQISSCPVIDNSRNLTNIANATTAATANTYVLRDADGNITANEFKPAAPGAVGATYQGGIIICKSGSIAYIVAPSSAEVSRTWYLREDAIICSGCCTTTTGWFVPTCGQLQNPGYTCRTFWDSFSSTNYWSSTEILAPVACGVSFLNGCANCTYKNGTRCVRAFRCVTY
jgi:hypothetical protein